MAYYPTREELRSDIRDITTELLQNNNDVLVRMINEDLEATHGRIDKLERRIKKHLADPHAHGA